ncbi:hypothetical protein BTVI_82352 [Pitangus sulphuratus]|nr:hypothetical protein BTVI_82352 [Pitangus sulphuratus]
MDHDSWIMNHRDHEEGESETELEDDEEARRERLSEAGLRSQGQAEGQVNSDIWLDFAGSITFGHIILNRNDDNPLIVGLYFNLRGYKKAKLINLRKYLLLAESSGKNKMFFCQYCKVKVSFEGCIHSLDDEA